MPPALRIAPSNPDLLAAVHFVGTAQISVDKNSAAFSNFWCTAEARALEEQTLQKLAKVPYAIFRDKIADNNDFATLLRPLLDDLLREESYFEMRGMTNQTPECALAIHLGDDRAQLWQTNLAVVLTAWTALKPEDTQRAGVAGWELKKHRPPNLIRFSRISEWVVIGCGQDQLPFNEEMVQRIKKQKRPISAATNFWLNVQANGACLSNWISLPGNVPLPRVALQIVGRSDNLRLDGTMDFAQSLPSAYEPWLMPTNTIREPFISFTAIRGIGSWVEAQPWFHKCGLNKAPDQYFCWAAPKNPFQTFLAAPVRQTTNAVRQVGDYLASISKTDTNHARLFFGNFQMSTNGDEVVWQGLPFVVPYLRVLNEPAGGFLLAGMFPNFPNAASMPSQLMGELRQPNLLYYDWEITAERLPECRTLTQLFMFLTSRPQLNSDSAATKWLYSIAPKIGNTVTVVTKTATNQLTFKRKAPVGLTAVELTVLAHWLEATNFPRWDPPSEILNIVPTRGSALSPKR